MLLPISKEQDYFKKYLENDILEIKLNFLINLPFNNKKIKEIIKSESNDIQKSLFLEFNEKTFELNKEEALVNFELKIKCGDLIGNEIAVFTCEIRKDLKQIRMNKKPFVPNIENIEIGLLKSEYDTLLFEFKLIILIK